MSNNTQASNRIQSLELMRLLQPFTQTGVMTTDEATNIISLFIKGDTKKIRELLFMKSIPDILLDSWNGLLEFL